jgi:hypothetical protein
MASAEAGVGQVLLEVQACADDLIRVTYHVARVILGASGSVTF